MEKKKAQLVKIISVSALVLLVGAFALNGWALNPKGDKDGILATVDEVKITQGEVDKRISAMLGPQAGTLPAEKLAGIRDKLNQRALDSLVVEALLTKAVEKGHIEVKTDEVEAVLTQLKGSLPTDVNLEKYLTTVGLTEKDLRQTIAKNLGIQKLVEQQTAGVASPVDQEIEAYYADHPEEFEIPETVEVRHILIAVSPEDSQGTKAEKMEKAEKIREQVAAGKDFETVAAEVSDCPSKANGGRLGILSRGQTVKPFEDAAFSRKVGEIGPVVETRFGYHVIEVLDHRDAGKTALSEVKETIAKHLTEQKKEQAVHAYIDSLKAAATIVFHTDTSRATDPA
jgi:peptidyl-prolyl cis-trans isomerase C